MDVISSDLHDMDQMVYSAEVIAVAGVSRHRGQCENGPDRSAFAAAISATSALEMKVRRPARKGRSSATGSPFLVTTNVSPAATASITFGFSLRSSRWAIVFAIRSSVERIATFCYGLAALGRPITEPEDRGRRSTVLHGTPVAYGTR